MDWGNYIQGLTLAGIPAILLVIGLVALLKQVGLPSSWSGVVAAVGGIVIATLIQLVATWPTIFSPVATVIATGILLGLASNGAYSQAKHIFVYSKEPEPLPPPEASILPPYNP